MLTPTPVVALHRAVAVAEVDGPAAALALVDELDLQRTTCSTPCARTCSTRLGRVAEARDALSAALPLAESDADRSLLRERLEALTDGSIEEG